MDLVRFLTNYKRRRLFYFKFLSSDDRIFFGNVLIHTFNNILFIKSMDNVVINYTIKIKEI